MIPLHPMNTSVACACVYQQLLLGSLAPSTALMPSDFAAGFLFFSLVADLT